MPNIKYGKKVYEGVETISIPLADGSGNVSFSAAGGGNELDVFRYTQSLTNLFRNVTFPEGYEATITINSENQEATLEMNSAFQGTDGIEKIKLIRNTTGKISASYGFAQSNALRIVDMSEFKPVFSNCGTCFNKCTKLEEIIGELDFSNVSSIDNAIGSCTSLKEIRFAKDTIGFNVNLVYIGTLSDASVQSLIDSLKDLTTTEARTLTFHKDIKSKLTEAQLTQITSKNWTLA